VPRKSEWKKPKEGFVLVNVFACFNLERLLGGVIRDDKGNFIVVCNNSVIDAIDANTLEDQAISGG
jgi:hypothetical protein